MIRAQATVLCPLAPRSRPFAPGSTSRRAKTRTPSATPPERSFTSTRLGIEFAEVLVGSGPAPSKGQRVRCHYTGRLQSSGAKFDSSLDRKQPFAFTVGVGAVIKGWDVGILGSVDDGIPPMKEGGKRVLVIPPDLAYGSVGAGNLIPPNATLVFDIELLPSSTGQLWDVWEGAAAQARKLTSWLDAV